MPMPIIVRSKILKRLLFSLLHALLMLCLIFYWTDRNLSLEPEGTFIKWQSLTKNALTHESREKRDAAMQNALFVDVSNDKVEIWDKNTETHALITDRSKLARFYTLVRGSGYSYVINDLVFDLPSPQDDSLRQSISALDKIASCIDNSVKSVIPIHKGGTTSYDYHQGFIFSDLLLKFRLADKTGQKSLPLAVYEDLYKTSFSGSGSILSTNKNTLYFNNLTLDAYITPADLIKDDGMSAIYSLSDLITYLEHATVKERSDMLQGKMIIVGDFKNDNCKTAFGEIPGPLVLYNLVLNIIHGNNRLTFGWIFFLFVAFTLLSYYLFYYKKREHNNLDEEHGHKDRPLFFPLALHILSKLGFELIFIFVTASISYFLFEKNIEIIALLLWINLLDLIITIIICRRKFCLAPAETRGRFLSFLFTNLKQK